MFSIYKTVELKKRAQIENRRTKPAPAAVPFFSPPEGTEIHSIIDNSATRP